MQHTNLPDEVSPAFLTLNYTTKSIVFKAAIVPITPIKCTLNTIQLNPIKNGNNEFLLSEFIVTIHRGGVRGRARPSIRL